jgi:hypothetical protein
MRSDRVWINMFERIMVLVILLMYLFSRKYGLSKCGVSYAAVRSERIQYILQHYFTLDIGYMLDVKI